MKFRDYYKVLGVGKTASAEEIKKAYRKLARKHHPDVNPGDHAAEAKFKELNEAHEVLGNPETREKYDRLGANWKQYEHVPPGAGSPFGAGEPFGGGSVHWNVDLGEGRGGRSMSEDEVREMFGENPFSDFFQTFFGGRGAASGGRASPHERRGRDLEHVIELSLEQAFQGVARRLSFQDTAGGQPRSVEVRIPAGVINDSRVRVAGQGEPGTQGGRSGDLYLQVRLRPHPVFECKGQNVYVTAALPVTTAVLGGEVDVPALDGTSVRLKIPPSTQPGQVFRLRGKGMPSLGRRTKRGDLYATVQITVPDRLSAEARSHYEALAALEVNPATRAPEKATAKDPAA